MKVMVEGVWMTVAFTVNLVFCELFFFIVVLSLFRAEATAICLAAFIISVQNKVLQNVQSGSRASITLKGTRVDACSHPFLKLLWNKKTRSGVVMQGGR